ncbi:hypothetical protein [Bosea sp. 685]|uniref:hypothetical protein n=1 Tax=Bosea sp. 685 TaxID=3080057 RepID=UPI00289368F8|nr:hypothetical protein [Bosea sp. 685]WNJ88716.1 hypothetical protein RMR04_20160 [Bosea sp. 685]
MRQILVTIVDILYFVGAAVILTRFNPDFNMIISYIIVFLLGVIIHFYAMRVFSVEWRKK